MTNDIEKLTTDLATRAAGVVITDQASADMATELIISGKAIVKKIKEFFSPLKESAKVAHQGLVDKEKAELAKVQPAVDRLDLSLSTWRAGEERKRLAAATELRRQEDIRRQLEEEVLRKVREAEERAERERKRLEEEAEKLRQEAAEKADDAAALKRIEEEREKLRLRAEESRRIAEEETTLAIDEAAKAESTLAPVPIVPEAPRTAGLSMRTYWKAEVIDVRALIQAVVDGRVAAEAVEPNVSYLNNLAGRLKGQVQVPGVRFYSETKMAEVGRRNGTNLN